MMVKYLEVNIKYILSSFVSIRKLTQFSLVSIMSKLKCNLNSQK